MKTFADKVIAFNRQIEFKGKLPAGIRIMNPFKENPEALTISTAFYKKFYHDNHKRHLILGINPGRFGAGVTGVPFTEPNDCKASAAFPIAAKKPTSPLRYSSTK